MRTIKSVPRASVNYMSLPFNPKLKSLAREKRKLGILSEVLMWNQLRNNKFLGLDFDRQKIIGNYIVDFYCASKCLVIEIDGSSHDTKQEYDAQRDSFFYSLGLSVIHIDDADVKNDITCVMYLLEQNEVFND